MVDLQSEKAKKLSGGSFGFWCDRFTKSDYDFIIIEPQELLKYSQLDRGKRPYRATCGSRRAIDAGKREASTSNSRKRSRTINTSTRFEICLNT